jgi:hypothetical protein
MKAKLLGTITPEMVIGLRHYPGETIQHFSPIDGYVTRPKPVVRLGIGALGTYQAVDIGKRVYKVGSVHQVENVEQVQKRTGRTFEQQKAAGEEAIKQAKAKYKGEKTIWGTTVWAPA